MYARFDCLAIAAQLLPSDTFKYLMRKEFCRIAHGKEQDSNGSLEEFWRLRENALHGLLDKAGMSVKDVSADPRKQDPLAASYCPLCGTEYRSEFTRCSDCYVILKKFEPSPSTSTD